MTADRRTSPRHSAVPLVVLFGPSDSVDLGALEGGGRGSARAARSIEEIAAAEVLRALDHLKVRA